MISVISTGFPQRDPKLLLASDMSTFGERLKREREKRKISLDDVARSTKISKRHLMELEEERFKDLPGGIFNKGFVRAYAKHLELNEEEMVREYVAADTAMMADSTPPIALETTKLMASMAVAKEQQESVRRGDPAGKVLSFAVAAVVVLGVGAFAYRYYEEQKNPAVSAIAASPAVEPATAVSTAVPMQTEAATSASPMMTATRKDAAVESPKNEKANSPAKPVFVELHANEESWLLVTADGKATEMTLAADQTKTFSADRELTMKLGNAEAVEITHNGKKVPAFAPGTKTQTVTFTPEL
jgi:cytoskeletal protein RodZ